MRAQTAENPRMVSLGFDPEPWPAGTHACLIFNDDQERRLVMSKYVQSGLDDNERVLYLVDTMSPESVKEWMLELGVIFPDDLEGQPYSIDEAATTYCPDKTFKVDRMIDTLTQAHERSIRDGYVGARVSGEMTWAKRGFPGSENLAEYESRVNMLVRTVPITAICQYDARLFDGATLYRVLSVHPTMIVHGQALRNPNYVEPEDFFANLAADSHA